nr:CerR family C-terminal domain-containing protein [Synergistaceae bacterium]
ETFSTIAAEGKNFCLSEILETSPELLKTPSGQAEIIREVVFQFFRDLFEFSRRDWKKRLIIQELFHPSPIMPTLVEKILKPDNEELADFFLVLSPAKSRSEAYAWADTLYAQGFFYLMAREPLAVLRGAENMGEDFLRTVAATTARSMILLAGLPLPANLAF